MWNECASYKIWWWWWRCLCTTSFTLQCLNNTGPSSSSSSSSLPVSLLLLLLLLQPTDNRPPDERTHRQTDRRTDSGLLVRLVRLPHRDRRAPQVGLKDGSILLLCIYIYLHRRWKNSRTTSKASKLHFFGPPLFSIYILKTHTLYVGIYVWIWMVYIYRR